MCVVDFVLCTVSVVDTVVVVVVVCEHVAKDGQKIPKKENPEILKKF